ncbi:MAG: FAD-dependent oxidoreductase, partial [Cyanobacteriota bacterium]|nr:FAD-dependent oxidoreductase [Cyanobacteriota bacterium]
KDIELSDTPEIPHIIVYTQADKKTETIHARWAIDAMGRRRFLQKKLGLAQPNNPKYSAAWFRIEGRVDVSDFVPRSEKQWHDRVPGNKRYYSTNHLCGEGYWVWLIPLSSGYTSIGIVADEDVHPFSSYHTDDRAREWLEKHEPTLAACIQGKPSADFKKMPRYSYSSKQVFSIDRWACVGEAGVFTDPFHSSGNDLIAIANCFTTEAIERDRKDRLTEEAIDEMNRFFLTYRDRTTDRIQSYYRCFTNETVMVLKYIWDIMTAWAFNSPLMFNSLLLDSQKRAIRDRYYDRFLALDNCVDRLFLDWAAKPGGRVTYDYIDYTKIDFMNQHRGRNFSLKTTDLELIESQIANLEVFEELAQAIFRVAVADTMPEQLPKLSSTPWLNAEAISLHPERWQADGLFSPSTPPRSLERVIESLSQILQLEQPIVENVYRPKESNRGWASSPFSRTHLKVPMG